MSQWLLFENQVGWKCCFHHFNTQENVFPCSPTPHWSHSEAINTIIRAKAHKQFIAVIFVKVLLKELNSLDNLYKYQYSQPVIVGVKYVIPSLGVVEFLFLKVGVLGRRNFLCLDVVRYLLKTLILLNNNFVTLKYSAYCSRKIRLTETDKDLLAFCHFFNKKTVSEKLLNDK